ncbi:S24/S26 family peptidase [Methanobacterium paludis]|nr:S24/S26 family peptidase [Methanobacterium paludis]
MKSRTWMILASIAVIALAVTAFYVSSNSHDVGITIKTNGTAITAVDMTSFSIIPSSMRSEIWQTSGNDLNDDKSTVDSFKSDIKAIAKKYNCTASVKIESQFGVDQLPMPASVKGTSMVPTLQDGQSIILLKTTDLKVGEIVVARHPTYGLIVKRLAAINGSQVYLRSDNRQIEVIGTKTVVENGRSEVLTIEKTPLDTWLPKENVVGVVKVY